MDLTSLANSLAKQFLADTNRDGQIDIGEAVSSLSNLLSGSGSASTPDLGGIVSKMQQTGLSEIVESWLGDGENQPISTNQIEEIFGSGQLTEFASSLNLDMETAESGLAKLVPELIDKSSSAGQLMDLVNAAGGLNGLSASLGKLFSGK